MRGEGLGFVIAQQGVIGENRFVYYDTEDGHPSTVMELYDVREPRSCFDQIREAGPSGTAPIRAPARLSMAVQLYAYTCGFLTIPTPSSCRAKGVITCDPAYLIVHEQGRVLFDSGLHIQSQTIPEGYIGRRAQVNPSISTRRGGVARLGGHAVEAGVELSSLPTPLIAAARQISKPGGGAEREWAHARRAKPNLGYTGEQGLRTRQEDSGRGRRDE